MSAGNALKGYSATAESDCKAFRVRRGPLVHTRRIDVAASSAPESESGVIQRRSWLCGGRLPEGTTLRVYPPQPCGRVPSAHSRGRLALQKPTPQNLVALAYFNETPYYIFYNPLPFSLYK